MRSVVVWLMGLVLAGTLPEQAMLGQGGLQARIRAAAAEAQGKVSVDCSLPGMVLDCALDPQARPPMQSVFKLMLGLTVLDQVERGKFGVGSPDLGQTVRFGAVDREPQTYSPLQDKYPAAEVDVPLGELLRLSVSLSDNVASDLLLKQVGGPAAVEGYVHGLGIAGFQLRDNERVLHDDVQAQYRNWLEPAAAVALLRRLNDRSPLSAADTALVFGWMRDAPNKTRLKGLLPVGTEVLQKTGTSDTSAAGVAYATNDIGLIGLPDGRRVAIAVFVTDARADDAVRDAVIAKIARAVYQAALAGRKQ